MGKLENFLEKADKFSDKVHKVAMAVVYSTIFLGIPGYLGTKYAIKKIDQNYPSREIRWQCTDNIKFDLKNKIKNKKLKGKAKNIEDTIENIPDVYQKIIDKKFDLVIDKENYVDYGKNIISFDINNQFKDGHNMGLMLLGIAFNKLTFDTALRKKYIHVFQSSQKSNWVKKDINISNLRNSFAENFSKFYYSDRTRAILKDDKKEIYDFFIDLEKEIIDMYNPKDSFDTIRSTNVVLKYKVKCKRDNDAIKRIESHFELIPDKMQEVLNKKGLYAEIDHKDIRDFFQLIKDIENKKKTKILGYFSPSRRYMKLRQDVIFYEDHSVILHEYGHAADYLLEKKRLSNKKDFTELFEKYKKHNSLEHYYVDKKEFFADTFANFFFSDKQRNKLKTMSGIYDYFKKLEDKYK